MNKIIKQSLKVKEELNKNEIVKEYLKYKTLIDESIEIKNLKESIAICNDKKRKEELIGALNRHPLVNNYNLCKDELMNLLIQIKNILSD